MGAAECQVLWSWILCYEKVYIEHQGSIHYDIEVFVVFAVAADLIMIGFEKEPDDF